MSFVVANSDLMHWKTIALVVDPPENLENQYISYYNLILGEVVDQQAVSKNLFSSTYLFIRGLNHGCRHGNSGGPLYTRSDGFKFLISLEDPNWIYLSPLATYWENGIMGYSHPIEFSDEMERLIRFY